MNNASTLRLRNHVYSIFTVLIKQLAVLDALQQRDCTVAVTAIHTHIANAKQRALGM